MNSTPSANTTTLREAMLIAASRATDVLGDSAPLVARFLHTQMTSDGGFADRAGHSDVYYAVFGVQSLLALGAGFDRQPLEGWLRGFGEGEGLDLVHLCSLARCRAALGTGAEHHEALLHRIGSFRSADGGYAPSPEAKHGTAYACFLALGGSEDCGALLPDPEGVARCLGSLAARDGGFANEHGQATGSTNATAAAIVTKRQFGLPVCACMAEWLLACCHPRGGFAATPTTPLPDLLSTATALHALATLGVSADAVREPCLDFLDSLWDSRGGFHATWADDELDCEYVFYGLLALGHLSP